MRLIGHASIRFGSKIITEKQLSEDRKLWNGTTHLVGICYRSSRRTEMDILRSHLFENTPLRVIANKSKGELILRAECEAFPYAIDGKKNFASFAMRLVPIKGKVAKVETTDSSYVNHVSARPGVLDFELGNDTLHLEIYFEPVSRKLKPLTPVKGFRENWRTRQ